MVCPGVWITSQSRPLISRVSPPRTSLTRQPGFLTMSLSSRGVAVAVGNDHFFNVRRLVPSPEEIDKRRVIVSGIHDREIRSLDDVNVRGKFVSGQEENFFEKRIRPVKKTRQRQPTGMLRLPLVRGFPVLCHIHPAPIHDRCRYTPPYK